MATSAASSEHFEKLHEIFRGLYEDLRGVPERLLGTAGTGKAVAGAALGNSAGCCKSVLSFQTWPLFPAAVLTRPLRLHVWVFSPRGSQIFLSRPSPTKSREGVPKSVVPIFQ
jgi:hypothetical protein